MGCVLAIIALITPRIVMIFIRLLTPWFQQSYDTAIWPVLGWLFMPYTTLAYMAAMLNNHRTVDGWWLALVVVAVLVDIGVISGSSHSRR